MSGAERDLAALGYIRVGDDWVQPSSPLYLSLREREERQRLDTNRKALEATERALNDFGKAMSILTDEQWMFSCYWSPGNSGWRFVWSALGGEGRGP